MVFLISFFHFFNFIIASLTSALLLYRNFRNLTARACFCLLSALALVSVGLSALHNPLTSKTVAWIFFQFFAVGLFAACPLLLVFTLFITQRQRLLHNKLFVAAIILPTLLFSYLYVTNNLISGLSSCYYGWSVEWNRSPGSFFFYLYVACSISISLYLLSSFEKTTDNQNKRKVVSMLRKCIIICSVILFIFCILLPLLKIRYIPNLADCVGLFFCSVIGYAVLKLNLFSVASSYTAEKIFSTMSDALFITDLKGNIQRVNKAALNMLSFDEKELLGKPIETIMGLKEHWDTFMPNLNNADKIHVAVTRNFETGLINKAGKLVPTSLSISLLKDTDKIPQGIIYIARDLGERKQTEETIRRLSSAVAQSIDGIAICDLDGNFRYTNLSFASAHSFYPEELLGMNIEQLLTEEDVAFFRNLISQKSSQAAWAGQLNHIRRDGSVFPTYTSITLLKNQKGEAVERLVICRDISDKREAEEQLACERDLLNTIMMNIPDLIFLKDRQSRIVRCNQAYVSMMGASQMDEVIGKTDFDFFPTDTAKVFFDEEQRIMATGKELIGREWQVPFKNGLIWLSEHKIPIRDKSGNIIGIVGISRDINARKQAEEQQLNLQQQLVQAQKLEAIGQLAGGVAHDFNNVLGAISGYAEMIKLGFASNPEELQKYANTIIESTKRAAELTMNLLAFARKGKYEMAVIDIHETIHSVIKLLLHTIDKRITIVQHLHAHPSTVCGDRTQLQNAVLNLAVNARDAMPEGGNLTFVTKKVYLDENYIKNHGHKIASGYYIALSVIDTGIGMDEKIKSRLFEPFFTTKPEGKGTGLGLASVYGTVKTHGGTIEVETEPKKGSKFTIFLPITTKTEEKIYDTSQPVQKGSGTILIIDDEELFRNMTIDTVKRLGYNCYGFKDGIEAIDYYKEHFKEIDLIILDLVMPKINGHECFRQIKQINPNAKVIVTSGYSAEEEARKTMQDGALGFIKKPFELGTFSKTIYMAVMKS